MDVVFIVVVVVVLGSGSIEGRGAWSQAESRLTQHASVALLSASPLFSPGTSSSRDDRQNHDNPPRPLKFGMSSTLCRLETLAEKGGDEGFGDAMRTFAVSQGVDSLAVMTVGLVAVDKL